jgi:dihydrofolate reductase
MMVSLDGYIEGPDHNLSWHNVDTEFNDFASAQMQEADTILMGRRTYQLMESFWPSKEGIEVDPVVAKLMNETPKVVISKRLKNVEETAHWKHVRLVTNDIAAEIQKLKNQSGKDILLDELRIMINPVVIGKGTPLFAGIKEKIDLKLQETRKFTNGNMLLTYIQKK